jgi:hypothetical protein
MRWAEPTLDARSSTTYAEAWFKSVRWHTNETYVRPCGSNRGLKTVLPPPDRVGGHERDWHP